MANGEDAGMRERETRRILDLLGLPGDSPDFVPVLLDGFGVKNGATVSVAEAGPAARKTTFTLTATPITLTDDPGNGQYGSVLLYTMPSGNILTLGAVIDAELTLNEAWWTDTAQGDVGLGSAAAAAGTALTSTTQNVIATTAIAAMTAQVGPIDAQSADIATLGAAGGTDSPVYLNVRIDDSAAHMPDIVTNGALTGNATGWTLGAGWAYGTNNAAATLADTAMSQSPATLVAGVSYSLVFDATRSAGSVRPSLGGTLGTARSSSATFTETIVAGSNGVLAFTGTGFSGTIDNVVCTPLTGSGTITGKVTVVWANLGDY